MTAKEAAEAPQHKWLDPGKGRAKGRAVASESGFAKDEEKVDALRLRVNEFVKFADGGQSQYVVQPDFSDTPNWFWRPDRRGRLGARPRGQGSCWPNKWMHCCHVLFNIMSSVT